MKNSATLGLFLFCSIAVSARPEVEVYANGGSLGLREPEGVAVDESGNVYTGGTEGIIWKITPDREFHIHARTGGRANGMCFDGNGVLYVCDPGLGAVLRVFPEGNFEVFQDTVEGERMVWPNYAAFDSDGSLYVSDFDSSRNCVYRIERNGRATVFLGPEAGLSQPNGLAFDATGEFLYVNETYARNVWRIPMLRSSETVRAGTPELFSSFPPEMGWAADSIQFDTDGNAYVATASWSGAIGLLRIDPSGNADLWVSSPHFSCPTTAVFGTSDPSELFVANLCSHTIARVTETGIRGLPLYRPGKGETSGFELR